MQWLVSILWFISVNVVSPFADEEDVEQRAWPQSPLPSPTAGCATSSKAAAAATGGGGGGAPSYHRYSGGLRKFRRQSHFCRVQNQFQHQNIAYRVTT